MKQISPQDAKFCREVLQCYASVDRRTVVWYTYLRSAPPALVAAVGITKSEVSEIRRFVSIMGRFGLIYLFLSSPRMESCGEIVYDVFAGPNFSLTSAIDIEHFNYSLCKIFDIDKDYFYKEIKNEN